MKDPFVFFLMGPTASGKTDLAVKLVQHLPCEIVSVDSAMVYRGMDIGTAKPTADLLQQAPHRLIDICDPVESYSAARFREDALAEIHDILSNDRIPLLVGGTMLYFRALERGLSTLPAANAGVRAELETQAQEKGWPTLHARLKQVDPQAAARIHPHDPQRIQRALEVYELTGKPMTELLKQKAAIQLPYRTIKLAVAPQDRTILRERIADRFHAMLTQGIITEVENLYQRGDLNPSLPAIRAVGYRQVWAYLSGELDYHMMIERAITATRQLAKRQLTWLRAEQEAVWFDGLAQSVTHNVLNFINSNSIS
jgi:tRNA dimethylallyltransferase